MGSIGGLERYVQKKISVFVARMGKVGCGEKVVHYNMAPSHVVENVATIYVPKLKLEFPDKGYLN